MSEVAGRRLGEFEPDVQCCATATHPARSVRLPWRGTEWAGTAGTACQAPSKNSWRMVLKRIRDLHPVGPENARGERLVTSQNRHDCADNSAEIRRQVRNVFEL